MKQLTRKELEQLPCAKITKAEEKELQILLNEALTKAFKAEGLNIVEALENHKALVLHTVTETLKKFMESHDLQWNESSENFVKELAKALEADNGR
jgi:hypothetical protein